MLLGSSKIYLLGQNGKQIQYLDKGEQVYSLNNAKKLWAQPISKTISQNDITDWYKVSYTGMTSPGIFCTSDHRFPIHRKGVPQSLEASQLRLDDILTFCGPLSGFLSSRSVIDSTPLTKEERLSLIEKHHHLIGYSFLLPKCNNFFVEHILVHC